MTTQLVSIAYTTSYIIDECIFTDFYEDDLPKFQLTIILN